MCLGQGPGRFFVVLGRFHLVRITICILHIYIYIYTRIHIYIVLYDCFCLQRCPGDFGTSMRGREREGKMRMKMRTKMKLTHCAKQKRCFSSMGLSLKLAVFASRFVRVIRGRLSVRDILSRPHRPGISRTFPNAVLHQNVGTFLKN